MRLVEFTIEGEPPRITAQQKGLMIRGGRAMFFTKKKVQAQNDTLVRQMKKYCPAKPIEGAVGVTLTFSFAHTKNAPKKIKNTVQPMAVRPDCDNLAKGVIDAMTECGFWRDDAQIAALAIYKCRSPKSFLDVAIDSVYGCDIPPPG